MRKSRKFRINEMKMYGLSIVIGWCITLVSITGFTNAPTREFKSFSQYEIRYGDTMTSIVKSKMKGNVDTNDKISDVLKLNNMKSTDIHAGCYLLIPQYK